MISRSCNPRLISSNNMHLKSLLLTEGVIVATCLSTFVAARQLAPEPSASFSSVSSSSSSLCSRELATTLWGAAFVVFSLMMADGWPASKACASLIGDPSLVHRLRYLLLFAPVAPLFGIFDILEHLFITLRFRQIFINSSSPELGADYTSMSNKLGRVVGDIPVILFGIIQPRGFMRSTRIVANTRIVLGMSNSTALPSTHIYHLHINEDNIADAFIIGHKTAENSCLMELSRAGKLALLRTSILPNYKQLRFLDGSSIISILVIGYVTSTVYRKIHHLPVSPIEAIGFAFSLLVIVCSVVSSVGVICQNYLVIYLNPTQEQEILDEFRSIRWSYVHAVNCKNAAVVGVVVVGSVVVAFMILVEWHVLSISWLDAIGPILFLVSLITQYFQLSYSPNIWIHHQYGDFCYVLGV